MLEKIPSSRLFAVVSWLVICSPVSIYLVDITDFGTLPRNDYYGIVRLVTDGDSFSRDPLRWLDLKSNEHRATVPMVVYALNMALTHGNNLGLTVYSLAVLTLILALLYRQLPGDIRARVGARTLIGLILGLFCYTPVVAHSVAMGFSGTQWFSSNLLAIAAMLALVSRAGRRSVWALWPIPLFGLLGAFTYSTSLLLWPALLAGALYLKVGRRRGLFLAAGATAVYSLFALTYEPLSNHPVPETRDGPTLARYTGVLLGSLLTDDVTAAKWVGWGAVLASLIVHALAAWAFRFTPSRHAPWLMIQIYALGNALGTAVSRSGFGDRQAMTSRYASTAALFWLGLMIPLAILVWRSLRAKSGHRIAALAVLAALAVGVAIPMHRRGGKLVDSFAVRGSRQGVAALAIRHGVRDDAILKATVTPAPHQVWALRDFFEAVGHVPFDRAPGPRLGQHIDEARLSVRPPAELRGVVESLVTISPGVVRQRGWVFGRGADVAEVALLDREGKIRGEVVLGIRRPGLKRRPYAGARRAGWEGYSLSQAGREVPRAYVRLAGDPTFYRLPLGGGAARQLRSAG